MHCCHRCLVQTCEGISGKLILSFSSDDRLVPVLTDLLVGGLQRTKDQGYLRITKCNLDQKGVVEHTSRCNEQRCGIDEMSGGWAVGVNLSVLMHNNRAHCERLGAGQASPSSDASAITKRQEGKNATFRHPRKKCFNGEQKPACPLVQPLAHGTAFVYHRRTCILSLTFNRSVLKKNLNRLLVGLVSW